MGRDLESAPEIGTRRIGDPLKSRRCKENNRPRTDYPARNQRRTARLHKNGRSARCKISLLRTRRKESSMSAKFVLIHGTWHGGWAWQGVIRHLEAQGHHAYAPTLIGHSPADERVGITYRDCVDSVVSYIRHHDLHDVILVGHSFGGSVI